MFYWYIKSNKNPLIGSMAAYGKRAVGKQKEAKNSYGNVVPTHFCSENK
jgi:hypothetical protein